MANYRTTALTAPAPQASLVPEWLRTRLARWRAQERMREELMQATPRDLADLGLFRSDIPDVVRGTYRRDR